MNQAQRDALDRVHDILGEHFEQATYVVTGNSTDEEDTTAQTETYGGFIGGIPAALGMIECHKAKLLKQFLEPNDEEDDDEQETEWSV